MIISFAFSDGEDEATIRSWIELSMYINGFFFLESFIYIILVGDVGKAYANRFKLTIETVCQVLNAYASFMFITNYDDRNTYKNIVKYF